MISKIYGEIIYIWYYITILLEQIFPYWILGMLIGSAISVFGKEKIHKQFDSLNGKRVGFIGIPIASILGMISPLCMYGTIPIAASFSKKGMREDFLAAFMMSSILINPQLIIYSMALGKSLVIIRIISCFLGGIFAGLLINILFKNKPFFNFEGFSESESCDVDPNLLIRFLKNLGRNIKATGPWFFVGILLSALFQRYVPAQYVANVFGNNGFGVLMAATIGVPLYACGGGTIPLLQGWLMEGMSMGSAAAFMITGPATKITNLGAMKIVLGMKNFLLYLGFIALYSFCLGNFINITM